MPLDGLHLLIEIPDNSVQRPSQTPGRAAIGGVEVARDDSIERL